MFNIDGKYGSIHLNGMTKNIENLSIDELEECLKVMEHKEMKLIEKQNEYISQIID